MTTQAATLTTDNLRTQPWPHQQDALDFIRPKPGAMLAMDMGTGKSKVAIDLMAELQCQRTLILAPLSIVDHVWPDQLRIHLVKLPQVVTLGDAIPSVKAKLNKVQQAWRRKNAFPTVVIVNYESAWREPLASWLMKQPWDLLVLDEIHRIKSARGQASRWVSRLSDRVHRRLGLTGTPMPNSPLDIYAQYRALNKRIYGTSNHAFRDRYAEVEDTGLRRKTQDGKEEPVKKIIGYKNLDELNQRFYSIAFRVETKDVLHLPPTMKSYYPIPLSPKAQRIYLQMERTLQADLEDGKVVTARNALTRLLRLQQVTSGYAPDEQGTIVQVDTNKGKALEDIIHDLGPNEPLIVFARFRPDLDTIAQAAIRQERPSYEFSGETKQLSEWRNNGGILAVQIQAGGIGLDFTFARYCVYYSTGFSLGDYLQSMARLHRPGQAGPVQYIHLVATGTVDELVVKALDRKEDLIQRVLKEKSITQQEE